MSSPPYLLVGSWVNTLLFGTELVLGGYYFYSARPTSFYRWSLAAAMVIDAACSIVVCSNVYLYLVQGEDLLSLYQPWPLPVTILCTYHVAMIEQVFFTYRYWQISHNKIVTFLISVLLLTHVAFAWVLGIELFINPFYSDFGIVLTTVAATTCAATDLFIAIVMFFKMRSIQTTYAATQSLIRRIAFQSVACGSMTAMFTIIMLILLTSHHLNPFMIIFDCLGRFYTLTVLVNFILLKKPMAVASKPSTYPSSGSGVRRSGSIAFSPMSNAPRAFTIPMELTTIEEHSIRQSDPESPKYRACNLDNDTPSAHVDTVKDSRSDDIQGIRTV